MAQLLAHLWGDYILQSHWMALNKTRNTLVAWSHALLYTLPFLLLTGKAPKPALAGVVILVSHFAIDRYALARYVVWAKNWLGPLPRMETLDEAKRRWRELGCVNSQIEAESHLVNADRRWLDCNLEFAECRASGYPSEVPEWLATWLLIIADNTLHLTINYVALRWL